MGKIKKGWLLQEKDYKMKRAIFFYRPHAVAYAEQHNMTFHTEIVQVELSIKKHK